MAGRVQKKLEEQSCHKPLKEREFKTGMWMYVPTNRNGCKGDYRRVIMHQVRMGNDLERSYHAYDLKVRTPINTDSLSDETDVDDFLLVLSTMVSMKKKIDVKRPWV